MPYNDTTAQGVWTKLLTYSSEDIFLIVKRCRSGQYLVCDEDGRMFPVCKREIEFFDRKKEVVGG